MLTTPSRYKCLRSPNQTHIYIHHPGTGEAKFIKSVRKDAVNATVAGSLEDRINRNRNFIQRTNADLDKGFSR